MSNVVFLNTITKLDIPAERVIDQAKLAELSGVVLLGYDKEGNEYFASSYADGREVLWLLERLKLQLLTVEVP